MKIFDTLPDTIGHTPLVRIKRLATSRGVDPSVDIVCKLEFFNPLSSVKDRLAIALIEDGEARGVITKDTVLIEPTSGNTGIGLAFICAARGYRLILTMPESMSYERRRMLRFFGAELVLTPAEGGMKAAIAKAEELVKNTPNAYMPRQFDNPANVAMHERTTAEEIWADTDGKVDVLVAGVGTGGTLTGTTRALKRKNPAFKSFAVEPADSPVLSGGQPGAHKIQGIGPGFIPSIVATDEIDEVLTVTNDDAFKTLREAAAIEGLPVGISGGAAIDAALKRALQPDMKGKRIVVIIPSTTERYLSLPAFKDLAEE